MRNNEPGQAHSADPEEKTMTNNDESYNGGSCRNTANNLCPEAESRLRQWRDQNFGILPTSLLVRAFGDAEDPDEGLQRLGSYELECEVCGRSFNYGPYDTVVLETDEDGEEYEDDVEVDLEDGSTCPACGEGDLVEEVLYRWPFAHKWAWYVEDSGLAADIEEDPSIATQAGFLVYMDPDGNLYLGIDGGWYNSMAPHWAPLYRLVHRAIDAALQEQGLKGGGWELPGDPKETREDMKYGRGDADDGDDYEDED